MQENDPNYKLCLEYAKSRVAYHRYLSVNGHEIKRRINGLSERFMAANRSHYSHILTELVDTLTNDPMCLAHREIDIHWSIMQFLLDISKDPVGALPKGDQQMSAINDTAADVESLNDTMMDELMMSLVACNAPPAETPKTRVSSDSELSVSGLEDVSCTFHALSLDFSCTSLAFLLHFPCTSLALRLHFSCTFLALFMHFPLKNIFSTDFSASFEFLIFSLQTSFKQVEFLI